MKITFSVTLTPDEEFNLTARRVTEMNLNITQALQNWVDSGPGLMPHDTVSWTKGCLVKFEGVED